MLADFPGWIKSAGSPIVRAGESFISGTDWSERPYTGVKELVTTGHTVKKYRSAPKENWLSRIPSWALDQAEGMLPIALNDMAQVIHGKEDLATGLLKALGLAIYTDHPKPKK
jgi:hypothetical protein